MEGRKMKRRIYSDKYSEEFVEYEEIDEIEYIGEIDGKNKKTEGCI